MKKLIYLLMIFMSIPSFAQQMEHGALLGVGVGFPMQDNEQIAYSSAEFIHNHYQNKIKPEGMLGYRLHFMPERKSFFDVDFTLGLQGMKSHLNTFKYINSDGYHYEVIPEKIKASASFLCPYLLPLAGTIDCLRNSMQV